MDTKYDIILIPSFITNLPFGKILLVFDSLDITAALKYYPAILLPTGPMGFALLNANIL